MNRQPFYVLPPPDHASTNEMQQSFMDDQQLMNMSGAFGAVRAVPGRRGGSHLGAQAAFPRPPADVRPRFATGNTNVAPSMMGWGGQEIQDSSDSHVPWFGRGHSRRAPNVRKEEGKLRNPGSSYPSALVGAYARGAPDDAMSVEGLVAFIQKLPKREALPDKVYRALFHLDSRALAIVLKDLSRVGLDKRAVELFDHLRGLPENHALCSLCDVYTFTAMISLCIYQQDVDRAMDLMEDMRRRNIERNVHTYTALMNVCIKCGKLPLALDIYGSMRSMGCVPNVVTFNTLVDVYGKLGQWEKAVHVVDSMKKEGVEPVLRTYNTLIIACNMCNQPHEALAVSSRLQADGFAPNSTTFNALISAYGKVGQLDKALDIYQRMLHQNMERSVITYSSLISACEKAGQWETALKIFDEMQHDGCAPNTVTFNSLITACAQGSQWEKANEVFEQMGSQGCTPDVVTYTALISAFERGGQWQKALQAFHKMCVQGCKPDAIVYNAIIDTLWETGVAWAQSKALQLFGTAMQQGHFRREPISRKPGRVDLNLHAMTAGVAMLSLYTWLQEIRTVVVEKGADQLPGSLMIITDAGKASREQGNCIIQEAVVAMMNFWEAPFRPSQNSRHAAVLEASGAHVADWVSSAEFAAQMSSIFPTSDSNQFAEEATASREQQVLQDCAAAFSSVQHFERTHGLLLDHMGPAYMAARPGLVSHLLEVSHALGVQDEIVHDSVLLMDRTASQAKQVPEDILPLMGIAAMVIAASQGDGSFEPPSLEDVERAAGIPASVVSGMEWDIRTLLGNDTSTISAMRCLKVYLDRLGFRFVGNQNVYGLAGFSIMLAVEALYDTTLLNCRPSVVAAALLYAERRLRGAVPFWPTCLSKLTGYEDMATPELTTAVRVAQKLARKNVYGQIYRTQMVALSQVGVHPADSPAPLLEPAFVMQPTAMLTGPAAMSHLPPSKACSSTSLLPVTAAAPLQFAPFPEQGQLGGHPGLSSMDSLAQTMQMLAVGGRHASGSAMPAPGPVTNLVDETTMMWLSQQVAGNQYRPVTMAMNSSNW